MDLSSEAFRRVVRPVGWAEGLDCLSLLRISCRPGRRSNARWGCLRRSHSFDTSQSQVAPGIEDIVNPEGDFCASQQASKPEGRSFRLWRDCFFPDDPLPVFAIAGLGRLCRNHRRCAEFIRYLPIEGVPAADQMDIACSGDIGVEIRIRSMLAVVEVRFRIGEMLRYPGSERIHSDLLGVKYAREKFEVRIGESAYPLGSQLETNEPLGSRPVIILSDW